MRIKNREIFKLLAISTLIFLISCTNKKNKIDISDVEVDVEIVRFEQLIQKASNGTDGLSFDELYQKYPDFIGLYSYRIIYTGDPEEEAFDSLINGFMQDDLVANAFSAVAIEFNDFESYKKELDNGFRRYHKLFPNKVVPNVYTFVSGYNESLIVTDNILGIGLEKYLGPKTEVYQQLGIQQYKRSKMYPKKIVSDGLLAWIQTEFPNENIAPNVLSEMIHEGKMLYLLDLLLPETADSVKTGFTSKKLDWCELNEGSMWTYLIENDVLFSNDRMTLRRYLGEAPSTTTFSNNSPGKASVWLGWQIVKTYMKKNSDVTVSQLIQNQNHQQILNQSGYHP